MKTILVVGASGATGRLLVRKLLNRGIMVRIIVRSAVSLPDAIGTHDNLSLIHARVSELTIAEMAQHLKGCDGIASCLGHNLNFKGVFGKPRRLVANTVHHLCAAIRVNSPQNKVKLILMNTAGNRNRDIPERVSFAEKCVIWLLRFLVPPHADNEQAADFLRTQVGQQDKAIEWLAIRPDTLLNEDETSEYQLYPSPVRSAIFDAGTTSRMNVAHCMSELLCDDELWNRWKGQMPVIYNKT